MGFFNQFLPVFSSKFGLEFACVCSLMKMEPCSISRWHLGGKEQSDWLKPLSYGALHFICHFLFTGRSAASLMCQSNRTVRSTDCPQQNSQLLYENYGMCECTPADWTSQKQTSVPGALMRRYQVILSMIPVELSCKHQTNENLDEVLLSLLWLFFH